MEPRVVLGQPLATAEAGFGCMSEAQGPNVEVARFRRA